MIDSKEDCPLRPGATLTKTFVLNPAKGVTKNWIALEDSYVRAPSSLAATVVCNSPEERNVFAIYVSYYVKIKTQVGALGSDVSVKLPFALTPSPADAELLDQSPERYSPIQSTSADHVTPGTSFAQDMITVDTTQPERWPSVDTNPDEGEMNSIKTRRHHRSRQANELASRFNIQNALCCLMFCKRKETTWEIVESRYRVISVNIFLRASPLFHRIDDIVVEFRRNSTYLCCFIPCYHFFSSMYMSNIFSFVCNLNFNIFGFSSGMCAACLWYTCNYE